MAVTFNPIQTTSYPLNYKLKSRLWICINSTIFRWTPFFLRKYRVAILKVFGANISWDCSINAKAEIIDPWNLTMGSKSSIAEDCCLRCRDKIIIGKNVCISRGVYLLTASHDITSPTFQMITAPIKVEDNVWIATKSIIGKGLRIGEGAVVAAYSNVVKDVEPWTVVGGNPARYLKPRIIKE